MENSGVGARIYPTGKPPENTAEALEAVLRVANDILRQCKLFSIDALKDETPTIEQIAKSLDLICTLVEKLDFEGDEMKLAKAKEYVGHVKVIGVAIKRDDEAELERQVEELNKRSFIL